MANMAGRPQRKGRQVTLTFTITSDVDDQEEAISRLSEFLVNIEPDGRHEGKFVDGKIGFVVGPCLLFPGIFYFEN